METTFIYWMRSLGLNGIANKLKSLELRAIFVISIVMSLITFSVIMIDMESLIVGIVSASLSGVFIGGLLIFEVLQRKYETVR